MHNRYITYCREEKGPIMKNEGNFDFDMIRVSIYRSLKSSMKKSPYRGKYLSIGIAKVFKGVLSPAM